MLRMETLRLISSCIDIFRGINTCILRSLRNTLLQTLIQEVSLWMKISWSLWLINPSILKLVLKIQNYLCKLLNLVVFWHSLYLSQYLLRAFVHRIKSITFGFDNYISSLINWLIVLQRLLLMIILFSMLLLLI